MNWTKRNCQLLKVRFGFWMGEMTKRKEHKRSQSKYQIYQGSSNLTHIRVKVREIVSILSLNTQSTFVISLSKDVRSLQDNVIRTNVHDNQRYSHVEGQLTFSDDDLERMNQYLVNSRFLNMLKKDRSALRRLGYDKSGRELQYDFVVGKTDLMEKDQLQFDLTILSILSNRFEERYKKEIQPFSLQALIEKTEKVFFKDVGMIDGLTINTDMYTDTDVKFRNINQLCHREERFIAKRKTEVFKNMKKTKELEHNLQYEEDVPNIAIIGSGGGMRAAVGMCGVMTALQDIGIYDCAMYTAGLSGSAWYLLVLYGYDKQHDPKGVNDIIRKKILNFRSLRSWKISPKWFSITDSFGDMIGELLCTMRQSHHCWSDQTIKLADGSVPLPLINALHSHDKRTFNDYEWIEFSPYEVYIPKYGVCIDMRLFGDQFYGGFALTEPRGRSIKNVQERTWYSTWSGIGDRIDSLFNAVGYTSVGNVPNFLCGIPKFSSVVNNPDPATNFFDVKQENMRIVDAGRVFTSPYPTILHPSRNVDVIISFDFSERREDRSWPFQELQKAEKWANKKCVPFPELGPQLEKIKKKWDHGIYEEVYVFTGDNSPTIVHFVLVDKANLNSERKDGKRGLKIFPHYCTSNFQYYEDDIDRLSLLVNGNIQKNKKTITNSIKDAIKRKQNKSSL